MVKLKQCYFCGRYFAEEKLTEVEIDDGSTGLASICQKCQDTVDHGVVKVEGV